MDFSETIEVKTVDKEDHFAIDSYFFAYFHSLPEALEQIRDAVRNYRSSNPLNDGLVHSLLDTTVSRSTWTPERSGSGPASSMESPSKSSGFRLSSIFRPFSDSNTSRVGSMPIIADLQNDDYTHISRKPNSTSFIPMTMTTSPTQTESTLPQKSHELSQSHNWRTAQSLPPPEHTYPPSTSALQIYPDHSSLNRESSSSSWTVGVPSWFKAPRKVFGSSTAAADSPTTFSPVKEVYTSSTVSSPGPISQSSGLGDLAFSVLETPDMLPDQETAEKFRTAFAYDEKETLLGCMSAFLFPGLH